jgi:hypothetical protein
MDAVVTDEGETYYHPQLEGEVIAWPQHTP